MYDANVNENLIMVQNVIQIKDGIMIHVGASICEKNYIWNTATCNCENGKYLPSIIDNSVSRSDDIIEEETKTVATNFNEKNVICKTKSMYILLAFLLITITLLITFSIYCYLTKYKSKQKYLLPYYVTNNKQKKFCINNILMKIESNDELKEIDSKNRTCSFFGDIMRVADIDFYKIL